MTSDSGWRDQKGKATTSTDRWRRWLLFVAVLALFAGFAFTITSPFQHPNGHFLFAVAGGDPRSAIAPAPFALEQYAHLTPLRSVLYADPQTPGVLPLVAPASIGELPLASGLRASAIASNDSVIVFLPAREVVEGGQSMIRPAGAGQGMTLSVKRVIDLVLSLPGKVKFLVLDIDSPLTSQDGLLLPDTFVLRVAEAVEATREESLWVMTSHSSLEPTHQSYALRRTVFGYYIARALKGEADLNQNRVLSLSELFLYVREGVRAWSLAATDDRVGQTPRLLWGGGKPTFGDADFPILPVGQFAPELQELDIQKGINDDFTANQAKLWADVFNQGIANQMTPAADRIRNRLSQISLPKIFGGETEAGGGGEEKTAPSASEPRSGTSSGSAATQGESGSAATGGAGGAPAGSAKSSAASPASPAPAPSTAASDSTPANPPASGPSANAPPSTPDAPAAGTSAGTGSSPSAKPEAAPAGKPADGNTAGGDADAKGGEEKVEPIYPAELPDLVDRLGRAWAIHDRLLAGGEDWLRPIDYAPEVWGEYQRLLLAVDRSIRAGWTFDIKPLSRVLDEQLLPMEGLVATANSAGAISSQIEKFRPKGVLGELLVDKFLARTPTFRDNDSVHELALLIAADALDERFDAKSRAAIATYATLIGDGSYADFTAWMRDGWNEAFASLDEFHPIEYVSMVTAENWPVYRQWLRCVWIAERGAVASVSLRRLQPDILAADRIRREGERFFVDRLRSDWPARAAERLSLAEDRYRSILSLAAEGKRIEWLANDLLNGLPHYIALFVHGYGHPELPFPTEKDLNDLFDLLETAREMRNYGASSLGELKATADSLDRLRSRIRPFANDSQIEGLLDGDIKLSEVWFVRTVLDTPLIDAKSRMRLIAVLPELEALALRNYNSSRAFNLAQSVLRTMERKSLLDDAARIREFAALEVLSDSWVKVQLRALKLPDYSFDANSPVSSDVLKELGDWHDRPRDATGFLADFGKLRELLATDRLDSWPTLLEKQLSAVTQTTASGMDEDDLTTLRRIAIWGRILNVPIGPPFDPTQIAARFDSVRKLDLANWLAYRGQIAIDESPDTKTLARLRIAVRDYLELAQAEGGTPPSAVTAPNLEIVTPDQVTFAPNDPQREIEVRVINRGTKPIPIWMVLAFDTELIVPESAANENVYLEEDLRKRLDAIAAAAEDRELGERSQSPIVEPTSPRGKLAPAIVQRPTIALTEAEQLRRAATYPYRPDLANLPPTLTLNPGESRSLPLRLNRLEGVGEQTKLLVRAITSESRLRRDTLVDLPDRNAVDLVVVSPFPAAQERPKGYPMLTPYPNRPTPYTIGLTSGRGSELKGTVTLLTPRRPIMQGPPDTPVSEAVTRAWLDGVGETVEVAPPLEVTLAPGQPPVTILPAPVKAPAAPVTPPPPVPPAPPADAAAAATAADPSAAGAKPTLPPGTDVSNGLIIVFREAGADRVSVRTLSIAAQRPRRYVAAALGYDAAAATLTLAFKATDQSAIPDGGIPLSVRITDNSPDPLRATLSGKITRDAPTAMLTANVAPDDRRQVFVEIDVDSFPRTFLYRFYPTTTQPNLDEWVDATRLTILNPPAGKAFRGPIDRLPIEFKIDAPVGAFANPRDELWVGVDANQDRVFRNEQPVRLTADRQTAVRLLTDPKSPTANLWASVGDFAIDVPAGPAADSRVNLLAELRVAGQVSWGDPVEVILDGQAPKVTAIRIDPGRVVTIGKALDLSLSVDDFGLSGVASVKCGFALPGTTQFPPAPSPVEATFSGGGTWTANVPTMGQKGGPHRLLIQVTDAAGNASTPESIEIELRTEAEAMAEKNQPKTITGTVVNGKSPVPKATVELLDKAQPPKVLATRTTDDQGRFRIDKVPPGPYQVNARGLVRNNRLKGTADLTVPEGQAVPPSVTVKIK
jgi:hypothetical protein